MAKRGQDILLPRNYLVSVFNGWRSNQDMVMVWMMDPLFVPQLPRRCQHVIVRRGVGYFLMKGTRQTYSSTNIAVSTQNTPGPGESLVETLQRRSLRSRLTQKTFDRVCNDT